MINDLIDLAIQIQQIPAPTFGEKTRAEFVRGLFLREGLEDVSMDAAGNVFARLPGSGSSSITSPLGTAARTGAARPLIVSAHLDTVFLNGTNLQVRREAGKVFGPGIGDNSLGVAALFGIIWSLREQNIRLPHDVWLVADVCEEGLGNLRGMRAVVERFGSSVVGYLVIEGLALGHVYHHGIGVKRYRIQVRTPGGHSWSDYGKPSAVHELAALVTHLTSLQLPREPRTTLNIGTISGGTGINVLASEACCELDLRSEDPSTLAALVDKVEELIRSANRADVDVTHQVIGERPAGEIPADHPLVQLGVKCLTKQGLGATLTCGSTDGNVPLSQGIPAIVLGVTTGGGAHTMQEFIEIEPVRKGIASIARFVQAAGI